MRGSDSSGLSRARSGGSRLEFREESPSSVEEVVVREHGGYSLGPDEFNKILADEDRQSGGSSDSLRRMYLAAQSFPLLTALDEVRLAKLIEAGDPVAKVHLINSNLRLSFFFGKQYRKRGMPYNDIVQEGNIGLMRTVEKFDYRKGGRFSTYAGYWIHQQIRRSLPDNVANITLPEELFAQHFRFLATQRRMTLELQRPPNVHEVAKEMGITAVRAQHLIDADWRSNTKSLDTPRFDGRDDEITLADLLADEGYAVEDEVENNLDSQRLREALSSLDPDEYRIVRDLYGLKGFDQLTQAELSRRLGVMRSTVRRREGKVLELLHGLLSQ